MKDLFDALAEHLTDNDLAKTVQLYNRQPERPDAHKLPRYPCVYVEFSVLEAQNYTDFIQMWRLSVTLHYVVKRVDAEKPEVLNGPSGMIAALSGLFLGDDLLREPFMFSRWMVDHDHDNVVDNQISFDCLYYFNRERTIDRAEWVPEIEAEIGPTL